MQGGHDLGGMHGLGPINREPEATEPVFHAGWEKTVFWLTLSCGSLGQWSLDASRHARERQHPADYLGNSYYENWLEGLQTLLLDKGLVTSGELQTGEAIGTAEKYLQDRRLTADRVAATLRKGGPSATPEERPPAFRPGDRVRVRIDHSAGHTRVPGYTRGRVGEIEKYCGWHVFPDRSAAGDRIGRPLYRVAFSAADLWGRDADPRDTVTADLWEDYLIAA